MLPPIYNIVFRQYIVLIKIIQIYTLYHITSQITIPHDIQLTLLVIYGYTLVEAYL